MLEAITRAFSRDYTLKNNGYEVGYIQQSVWTEKATLVLDGYSYSMYHNGVMSGWYRLELNGAILADAKKSTWQHNYEIDCAEGHFSLTRRSIWNHDYTLLANGQQIGYISRQSTFGRDAEAELSAVSPAIGGFLLWLVITSWQEAQQAAVTAAVH